MTHDDRLLAIYRTMMLSRCFDERCAELLAHGTALPHYHSGIGQEALMVGAVAPLRREDQILYTHRGYGHLLAKGVPLTEIALDLFNKVGGTNHGLGGVMHVARPDLGVPGREGIFGTRFAIAAGLALASKLRDEDWVVVCFFGEAAGSRGILYESLNMAVLWKLPVVFVAENNGWSFSSRTEWLYPEGRMTKVWRGFGIPVETIDGNDVQAVYDSVTRAVAIARGGDGPSVIEGLTYRLGPHIWWDDASYQPSEEIERWRALDPLPRAACALREDGSTDVELDALEQWARGEVREAFAAATAAPAATWADAQKLMGT